MPIRLATRNDLSSIVAIYNSTIPSRQVTADLTPVSLESRIPWFDAHPPDRRPLWILTQPTRQIQELGGESRCAGLPSQFPDQTEPETIAGWLSLQDFYGRSAYQATAEISLYLHPNHRRQGLGSQLLHHALTVSPNLGVQTLLGFIFAHNTPSLQLFEKFGFTPWGHLPRIANLDGQERDLLILGLRLP